MQKLEEQGNKQPQQTHSFKPGKTAETKTNMSAGNSIKMISSVSSVVTVAILPKNVPTPGSPAKCIWLFNRHSQE